MILLPDVDHKDDSFEKHIDEIRKAYVQRMRRRSRYVGYGSGVIVLAIVCSILVAIFWYAIIRWIS